MALYSMGVSKAAPTTGTCIAMIRPASSNDVSIREIGVFNSTAVASSVGLVRTATTGTPSTSALVQSDIPGLTAGGTNIDTAWSAAPTIAAVYFRKIVLPATIGAGIIWSFEPRDLIARNGATTQVCLWNFGAGTAAALEVYVVIEE
jgi:hypothetical protein